MNNCKEKRVQAGSDGAGAARTLRHTSSWLKAIVPLATLREIACLGDKFMNMLRN